MPEKLQQKSAICGFAPIVPEEPKLIILGTMPSVKSLQDAFYYAHPRNAFWPIISSLVGRVLISEEDKRRACNELGILLWDVLSACEREGSLDSAIKQPEANDFAALLAQFPHIKSIFFNGQPAAKLFQQQVIKKQSLPDDLILTTLTSTSPANARLTIDDKILFWKEKLSPVLFN
ncbi:DNA-deoxyinosine glycosylase [Thiomicrorhabdus sp. 6S3-12]|uniref:DNA-deoxyinosine glycosylase n=1 Tax=Thiomicrorhabdus sp. 6S3-12 TaxID=2819681 RepID=UPI001AACEC66|nr:DNA-deoxyinosine glycosylase [Thiomicrorhabdus sp. 6S3-12]MBO1924927.1 DNA-deoxyinosine glycosylase [Thiomicrorhabdus sp. 6S3-12]